jgi:hypothetical protein
MENLEPTEVLREILDALENDVPKEVIWHWIETLPTSNKELDLIVASLEEASQPEMATYIASKIETLTLHDDLIRRESHWSDNNYASQATWQEPKPTVSRKWIQLYEKVYPESVAWTPTTTRRIRNEL